MKAKNHEKYVILEDHSIDVPTFASVLKSRISENYANQNLIVNLLNFPSLKLPELLLFLSISNKHRISKHSFVIVNSAIEPAEVPDEMIVVPTIREAADIIEMEEIERDLGF